MVTVRARPTHQPLCFSCKFFASQAPLTLHRLGVLPIALPRNSVKKCNSDFECGNSVFKRGHVLAIEKKASPLRGDNNCGAGGPVWNVVPPRRSTRLKPSGHYNANRALPLSCVRKPPRRAQAETLSSHWAHTGQGAESESVLRIDRTARGPSL